MSSEASVMSAEYAGKRQRVGGDGLAAAVLNPAETSATSSTDLESMLKQALGRIGSLERQHGEMKTSMERETKALRDDIETLKSKNKVLEWSLRRLASKAQEGWEYPVAIQPDEYWQKKGYDDEAIFNLQDRFLEGLKDTVSELEHGVCQSIQVRFVDHDEDLMPHWNALFRSFEHINPYGEGVALLIESIELDEEIMRGICHHIRYKNISQVCFEDIGFTTLQAAFRELGNALKSPKLKCLDWSQNPIHNTDDMSLFMRILSQSDVVEELFFNGNGNDNAQALLSGVDFSTYKLLDFSGNDLQTNGGTDIPDLIAANASLKSLNLHGNRLNDDDAVMIAQSLGGNTNLRRLYVEDNNIQERGMRALYEAVNNTSTLNELSDSNHSCFLQGLSDKFDLEWINNQDGPNGLYENRMCKIHKLMAERYRNGGGNVPHLNLEMSGENAVLLAPFLMESVVRRHDAFLKSYDESSACSLGLLYELVKDWKMAELFSFR
ncbi:hypothetical protein THAOC_35487 [Thalassiosira oceanica]|uniref:Uncharacterized protein n=1 Tax=Thalassiosira oceanica TaxID=159749 RepID=K0RH01_THAOC|nr:hypothetical protein THAOC_35487 [Thalassiosira oceanica]|eukprot:EJK45877.1 hypothetical protein THAOC_35487 [Thalassiosira oceanica]